MRGGIKLLITEDSNCEKSNFPNLLYELTTAIWLGRKPPRMGWSLVHTELNFKK